MNPDLQDPLEPPAVRETVRELLERVSARLPERGLPAVCQDLLCLVEEVESG